MSFFEDLGKKVQDVAYVATEKAQDFASVAGEKVQNAAESVKISAAIAGEQRSIAKNYRAIGEWYVSEVGAAAAPAVADIVAAVRASQAKIAELEASRGSKEEKVINFCPNCGAVISGKFCSACGTQIEFDAPAAQDEDIQE